MKIKNDNFVETQLKVKSTASLRQEIISELTQPDKSLVELLNLNDKDQSQDSDRVGQTDSWK